MRRDRTKHSVPSGLTLHPTGKENAVDPNATWLEMSQAVANDDWERAAELADILLCWLKRGGFAPVVTADPKFNRLVVQTTCQAIASWEVECV